MSVAVRPERVEITPARAELSGANRISGLVVELIYFGGHSLVVIEAAGGTRFTAHVPRATGGSPAISGGQTLDLTFAVSDTFVLVD